MTVPYENANSGAAARGEIVRLLEQFGCESVGFMDNFKERTVLLAFTWRGRKVQLVASASGWARMYLKENSWNTRRKYTESQWEARVLRQGMIAVDSILRDWVKGQVTAMETGVVTFDQVMLPYMLTPSGKTVAEIVAEKKLLEGPK